MFKSMYIILIFYHYVCHRLIILSYLRPETVERDIIFLIQPQPFQTSTVKNI